LEQIKMAWERLHHGAITAGGNTGTFTPKTNMRVILDIVNSGAIQPELTFGNSSIDTGNNYSTRGYSKDVSPSADYTRTSQDSIETERATTGNMYLVFDITNVASKEKLVIGHAVSAETAGAGNAPVRWEIAGKWANTSNQINIIGVKNSQAGSFASGSTITVLGAKEPGTSDTITVSDITAKKHLMIQYKGIRSGDIIAKLRFNNDSGNNYAQRLSDNGGSDGTNTSQSGLEIATSASNNEFSTIYVVNEAAKEKLVVAEIIGANTAGAGNAPRRRELSGKWANTSNAITRVDFVNTSTGDFAEGSEVTVYGTD
jgi:hypothetical protein